MKNKPKQITISVKKYATGGQLKAQNNAGMTPYLYNSLPQYGLGSWLAENAGTIGSVAGGIIGSVIPGAGTALGASIGGSLGGIVTNMHNQGEANDQKAEQVAMQQQQLSTQNAMNNYNAQQRPMYGTNFATGGFMPNVNTWQYSNVGGMNYGNGGGLYRTGAPYAIEKDIPVEFPYNGQSMYKGGYDINRANQLYKPDNTGHLPSVDNTNGIWLKDKNYPTSWKEYYQSQLNLGLNKEVGNAYQNENGRLQYPKGYANGGQLGNDNRAAQMTKGLDNITVYPKSAGTHEDSKYSGIKVGNKGLTEGGETRVNGYIFSNRF